ERQFMSGDLELEFNPQGTLAERLRAGGAGIPAVYTPAGVATIVAEGKETREVNGRQYVMERGIIADLSLVKAWKAGRAGNRVFGRTTWYYNLMGATSAPMTFAGAEKLGDIGPLEPDQIPTAGIFAKRLVITRSEKRIEQRTVSRRS